jgi:hypothetical protein
MLVTQQTEKQTGVMVQRIYDHSLKEKHCVARYKFDKLQVSVL